MKVKEAAYSPAKREIKSIEDYENIIITDDKGIIRYTDLVDLRILEVIGVDLNSFVGRRITDAYTNVTEENSTVLSVLRTGEPVLFNVQEFQPRSGKKVTMVNSTYPIREGSQIIGTIEYSSMISIGEQPGGLEGTARSKVYRKNNTKYTIDDIVTINPLVVRMKDDFRKIALVDSAVLLYGKTGTGKDLAAQSIHNLSLRYKSPFVSLNCGAIPANLVESTLFGTVKGSFTGSLDAKGLFEEANGGTLFLDEINSLDLSLQVKLLKALEEKSIRRVGGTANIDVDIRIIAATNEPPNKLVEEKRLRDDLYYRLSVIEFELPPLCERKEDIPVLAQYYFNLFRQRSDQRIKAIDDQAMKYLCSYNWPGNVRELRNVIESAFHYCEGETITTAELSDRVINYNKTQVSMEASVEEFNMGQERNLKTTVDDFEKAVIKAELDKCGGNIAATARQLGVSKQVLKYKMDKYLLRKANINNIAD